MIELKRKSSCSGCCACVFVCPKQCITMEEDQEGFSYPHVKREVCIGCNLCEEICPYIRTIQRRNHPKAFACFSLDEEIRKGSSSGGIFTLLGEEVIENGGVVYGAAFDENYNVKTIKVDHIEELEKLCGSKYVQCSMGNSFIQVKDDLKKNKTVYFSGTPCQIDGLKKYLGKDYENLICQDLICHGVPSPKLWKKYLSEIVDISSIKKVSFRNKENGWKNYAFKIEGKDVIKESMKENLYLRAFLKNLILRPSCYECQSRSLYNRNSDITLGDFWGIDKMFPDMNDDKGISLLILHSDKGEYLFDKVKKRTKYRGCDLKKAVKYNTCAYRSFPIPKKREKFFQACDEKNFSQVAKKYTGGIVARIGRKIKNHRMIPEKRFWR